MSEAFRFFYPTQALEASDGEKPAAWSSPEEDSDTFYACELRMFWESAIEYWPEDSSLLFLAVGAEIGLVDS